MMHEQGDDEVGGLIRQRGQTHGPHWRTSIIEQALRDAMRNIASAQWQSMPTAIRSALDEMARKQARIISGDPTHEDHWLDIEGAARLGRQAAQRERDAREWQRRKAEGSKHE